MLGAGVETRIILRNSLTNEKIKTPKKFLSPNKPHVFLFENLSPDCCYSISVSGPTVHPKPPASLGKFFTIAEDPASLKFAVVCGDRPANEPTLIIPNLDGSTASPQISTEVNLWDWLGRDLDRSFSQTRPNILLHLGNQVDVRNVYDSARLLIDRFRKCNPPPLPLPSHVRDDIKELFRVAYRFAWNKIPNVKHVLANVSNIMVCGITDVVGTLVRHSQLEFDPEIAALGLHVAREYQQKLWDVNVELRLDDELNDLADLTSTRKDHFIEPMGHFHR